MRPSAKPLPSGKSLPVKCRNGGNGCIATVGIEENGKEDEKEMRTSNANKVISVLMSVAMCPMMVPSAAFAADDDTASGGGSSSSTELTQSSGQAEGADTDASSGTSSAAQPEATARILATNANAAPAATAGEAAGPAAAGEDNSKSATGEETAEAAVAEANGESYSSLQAAIDAALSKATVKLLADTKENVTISTNNVTLDLNGHTLNGGTVKAKPALTVTARGVTVKDSSETQTGTIKREDTAENSGVSSHYVIDVQGNGWLTFESGNVTNNSGNAEGKGASLVRVGDDGIAKYPGLNIKGGTFTQDNFIVIKVDRGDLFLNGGTLNSANSYAIEDWHRATIKGGTVNGAVAAWTYSGGHNSDLTISGGTVNGNVISVNYGSAKGKVAKVSITGGTVNGTLGAYTYNNGLAATTDAAKATIKITGGAFSNDPTKYVVEDSAINKNADGTYGVEKAYLAQVGETSYYTMDEAFKAQTASGEAITLLRDYTTGSTFSSGAAARVVDLNGHTWTCTGTDVNSAAFEINNPNASLTVKNGKIVSSQLIGLIPSASSRDGVITYDNSTLTFEGVEATTTATSGIETNGNNANDTVVLKNSTLNVPNGFGIYFPSSGTLTIDNSTINAKTMGAQVCSGNLNVNAGSKITVSGDPVAKTEGDGAIQDGAAISIVNRPGYKGLGQIAITGGAFTANGTNAAIKAYTWNSATKQELDFDNTDKKVTVYGGTFSSAVPEALCAEGCSPVENPDGTHGVSGSVAQVGFKAFNTLQAAIDAAQDGETVTLLADATEDATVAAGKNITLNLGGKTLTNTNAGKASLTIAGDATATVKNGNIVGGTGYYTIDNYGTATLEDVTATAGNTDSSMIRNDGTLTIKSGSYSGGLNVVKSEEDSTLTINGGKFELSYATNGYTGVVLAYGNTTITGGEFIQSLTTTGRWNHPQVVATGVVEGHTAITRVTGGHFVNKMSRENIFRGVGKGTSDNFEVSGGTFNKSISEEYCTDGFIPTKNADGTYGVKEGSYVAQVGSKKYETLADAIRLSAKGKTITLLTDVEQNSQLTIGKDITLDLNGKTIKNTVDIWGDKANAILSIANGAKVTITGDGTIDAKENDCYTINVVKGDLTIENGTFYGNVSVVQVEEGTLSVKGGTFDLRQKWEGSSKYLFNCIDSAYVDGSANVAISGGTFVGFDPSVSPEGEGTSYLAPGYAPTDNGDGTYGVVAGVAQIGSKAYATLAGAVAAAQDGDTITLLSDCSGDGIVVKGDTFPNGLTIDFAGHSYTVDGKLVGSTGTASNGFQLLKGNTIVMRNGSIFGDASVAGDDTTQWSGSPAIMIQNCSNLTLDGMTVKGGKQTCYTLSNNNGDTVIKDSTIVAGQNKQVGGPWAFDVCRYASYPSVSVTVEGNSVIEGSVDVSGAIGKDQSRQLTITGGKFNKAIQVSTQPANIAISGGTFATEIPAEYCAAGYAPADNGDGTYGVKLPDGACALQDYRSGDPTSWTYPAKENMAFAGWYKDASFTTPCASSDVEGAAFAKFVSIADLLQFKGGSLRMDKGEAAVSTDLRFGYTKAIPEGATYISNGWYIKSLKEGSAIDDYLEASNNVLNNDGTVTSNLVLIDVPKNCYKLDFAEKAFVKYVTVDGTTVEAVEGQYQSRSVSAVADAILHHPMASQYEKQYANDIMSAIQ